MLLADIFGHIEGGALPPGWVQILDEGGDDDAGLNLGQELFSLALGSAALQPAVLISVVGNIAPPYGTKGKVFVHDTDGPSVGGIIENLLLSTPPRLIMVDLWDAVGPNDEMTVVDRPAWMDGFIPRMRRPLRAAGTSILACCCSESSGGHAWRAAIDLRIKSRPVFGGDMLTVYGRRALPGAQPLILKRPPHNKQKENGIGIGIWIACDVCGCRQSLDCDGGNARTTARNAYRWQTGSFYQRGQDLCPDCLLEVNGEKAWQ